MVTLKELKYQDDAIVSKVLMKGKNGTVTLFAFAEGQELSEHTAPFDALVHVLEGQLTITIGSSPQDVPAGSLVVMPANVPHALKATQPSKMVLTMIRDQAA